MLLSSVLNRFCYVLRSCLETEFSATNGIRSGPVTHDFESRFYIYITTLARFLPLMVRKAFGDFPDGLVVKNVPANAGVTRLGKFHMPQGN